MSGKEWLEQLDRLPSPHAKIASFERAWKAHPGWFDGNLEAWRNWLFRMEEEATGEDDITAARARRLVQDTYGNPSAANTDSCLSKAQLHQFALIINRELWSHGKHPDTITARQIARHPACVAAGLRR